VSAQGAGAYRVSGLGHHQITFEALELAMGPKVAGQVAYFDIWRRKRNQVDYDFALVASETEVEELLRNAEEFGMSQRNGFAGIIRNIRGGNNRWSYFTATSQLERTRMLSEMS
jgi:hypothetical protein